GDLNPLVAHLVGDVRQGEGVEVGVTAHAERVHVEVRAGDGGRSGRPGHQQDVVVFRGDHALQGDGRAGVRHAVDHVDKVGLDQLAGAGRRIIGVGLGVLAAVVLNDDFHRSPGNSNLGQGRVYAVILGRVNAGSVQQAKLKAVDRFDA